jgi:hypothetical protein
VQGDEKKRLVTTLALAALVSTAVHLVASSPQEEVLLGEPLKIVVRWEARAPVSVLLPGPFPYRVEDSVILFRVQDSLGSHLYGEHIEGAGELLRKGTVLQKGDVHVTNLVLTYGVDEKNEETWPCRTKGRCSIQVVYGINGDAAVSNPVTFDVTLPKDSDKNVFETVSKNPIALLGRYSHDLRYSDDLITRYPASAYLRWSRLLKYEERLDRIRELRDPQTDVSMRSHLATEQQTPWRQEQASRLATELLAEQDFGPFEEERLDIASGLTRDEQLARALRAELLSRFPASAAAEQIKADEEAEQRVDSQP